jgi:hypothetical protein
MLDVATSFAPVNVHSTVADLLTAIYHHGGSRRTWYIVAPRERDIFHVHVKNLFEKEIAALPCSDFVNHLSLWLHPDKVRSWGVTVSIFHQMPGGVLFLLPKSYFWGFSDGFSIIERKLIPPKGWDSLFDRYKCCVPATSCDDELG